MSIFPANDAKFDEVRALNLPIGRYAITSSGPLGIRDIRQIGDIDLIVDDGLWEILSARFGTVTEDDVAKIRIGEDIEILGAGSFLTTKLDGPTVDVQLAASEVHDGLSFVSLEHILWFKEHMMRDKHQADIAVLKRLLGVE